MLSLALLPALAAVGALAALPPVTVKGNAFYAGAQRFYVRGIDYQPGGAANNSDPLANTRVCNRDIEKFKKLGVNTIRVYITDNTANHDACMAALDAAGIYLVVDVNNPLYSINRAKPAPSYNAQYLQSVFATVDTFVKYSNTLAFFSGNEVLNEVADTTKSAPFVKAVTRDIKNYLRSRGHRLVPVGYSAADVKENRLQTAQYMNCGPDDARSDFFAFNDYSWCNTNFELAEWDAKVKTFTGYGLPIFLSEWGCIANGRDFGEVEALMSSRMTSVYSGGLMYEYTLEENNFGIVKINPDGSATEQPEFAKFAAAMRKFPAPSGDGGASATSNSLPCPTEDAIWEVNPSLIPAMPADAEQYMRNGPGVGPGLNGPGSQNSGPDDATLTTGGTPSPTGSRNAAAARMASSFDKAPLVVSGVALVFTLLGAMAL